MKLQKIAIVTNRADAEAADIEYWRGKSHTERLEAIEFLRTQYINYKYNGVRPEFQRVCTITKREKN